MNVNDTNEVTNMKRGDDLTQRQSIGAPTIGTPTPGAPILIMTRDEIERQLKRHDSLQSKMRNSAIVALHAEERILMGLYQRAADMAHLKELKKQYKALEEHLRHHHHHEHRSSREDSDTEKLLNDGMLKMSEMKLSYETWKPLIVRLNSLNDERNEILREAHRLREEHRAGIQTALKDPEIQNELKLVDPSLHEELQGGLWEKMMEKLTQAIEGPKPDPVKMRLDSVATLHEELTKKDPNALPADQAFPIEVRQAQEIEATKRGNLFSDPAMALLRAKIDAGESVSVTKFKQTQNAFEKCPTLAA